MLAPAVHRAAVLEHGGATFTAADLGRRSHALAQWLTARGFAAGDRLAVYLDNRVAFIDVFLACARTGIILVPINILYREREVSHIVADAQPKGVVAAGTVPGLAGYLDVRELEAVAAQAPDRRNRGGSIGPGAGRSNGSLAPDEDGGHPPAKSAPLAIVYTSGTTGAAKGAILTHGNFLANARTLAEAWRITEADRLLLPLPLFHVHGLGNGVCAWLLSGCRMRLLERFAHETAAGEFLSFAPTLFFGVPTIYVRLLGFDDGVAKTIGAAMRLFVSGSAPLPAHVHDAFRAKFGHAILERYGMTETLMNVSNPYDGERRPGAVGLPLPGVRVRIVAGGREAAPGEVGEVQVRGDNVFAGYWRRDEASHAAFVDGWFRTGDLGVREEDGYISLRGRATDLIISGGFNIYPREIEEVIQEDPAVREAVVVGAADPLRGEVPVAYVAVDDGFDEGALADRLRLSVASFKIPRAFVRVERLPRTALGKVQKHLLPPWP
jgi:malonyl-CoA/methylmalonyl-CoA synthetase